MAWQGEAALTEMELALMGSGCAGDGGLRAAGGSTGTAPSWPPLQSYFYS